MKRVLGILIMIGLLTAVFSPLTIAKPVADEINATPVFLDIYTSPRYPLGANWATGLGGDNITVFANVSNALNNDIWVTWAFCNRVQCLPDSYDQMTYLGGTMYKFVLPGDAYNGWSYFEASSAPGQHIYIRLEADPTDGIGSSVAYPSLSEWHNIYPAWPPQQFNATSALSKTTMWTGETFWVNGTSNYWNSTSYPGNYSQLFPADECPVTVTVGGTPFNGKTDIDGNYHIQVTAPATPGQYTVNTTVSNATANRNVPCKAVNQTITVNEHWMNVSLYLNSTTTLPDQPLWANGTVWLDGNPVNVGYPVNVSIGGGDYNSTVTLAGGVYSAQITTPSAVGNYTVTVDVDNSTYGVSATNTTGITVVAVPVPDLVIANANIKVIGNLVEGKNLSFNSTVFNMGIATATDAMINITLDSALFNSSKRTIAAGANTTISLAWEAVPGLHYLNVSLDPMNTKTESSELNNIAGVTFTVQADFDRDSTGDATDPDDDNDGVNDTEDDFPFNASETVDTDADGIGNNADPDDDGDGILDAADDLPLDPDELLDTDDDGIGNNADPDDDGDGINDAADLFPLDGTESADADGDGIGNNADTDDDADGLSDAAADPYPNDTDNDGLTNSMDSDDDNDGILDVEDSKPFDTDNDGLNNAADSDDDGDSVPDSSDEFPLDDAESVDTDGDGTGNNADTDDDDDGVLDADDLEPLNPAVGEAESASNSLVIAAVVVVVIVVVALLAYMFVIRPKMLNKK